MNFISKYLGKDDPVSEGLVRELHKIIVAGVRGGQVQPGAYRKIQNYVANSRTKEIIYTPPPPLEVPHLMREFVDWINGNVEEVSPVLVSAIAQFQFVHIHPFVDGNGRIARLLALLYLYKYGYDFRGMLVLEEYWRKDLSSLEVIKDNVLKSNSLNVWLEYFAQGMRSQLEKSLQKIHASSFQTENKGYSEINDRQKAIVSILEFPHATITNRKVQRHFSISQITASRDLSKLTTLGLLVPHGKGRSVYYTRT